MPCLALNAISQYVLLVAQVAQVISMIKQQQYCSSVYIGILSQKSSSSSPIQVERTEIHIHVPDLEKKLNFKYVCGWL
jgi:hypothetical protein